MRPAGRALLTAGACGEKGASTEEAPVSFVSTVTAPSANSRDRPAAARTLPRTTEPVVALGNLDVQIDGRAAISARDPGDVEAGKLVVALLLTRGQYADHVRDYERADAIARDSVARNPQNAAAHLTLASTLSTFHLFAQALAEIDFAASAPPEETLRARAGITWLRAGSTKRTRWGCCANRRRRAGRRHGARDRGRAGGRARDGTEMPSDSSTGPGRPTVTCRPFRWHG